MKSEFDGNRPLRHGPGRERQKAKAMTLTVEVLNERNVTLDKRAPTSAIIPTSPS